MFLKEVYYWSKIEQTFKYYEILLQFKITVVYLNIFYNVIIPVMTWFQLQCHPSEIYYAAFVLIIINIINDLNSCAY